MNNNHRGMTLIVKTVTRLTVGLILIYGIFIVLEGHIGPGGGFAGGVIIALSFIHLILAFGKEAVLKKLDQERALFFASLGGLAFLLFISFGLRQSHRSFGGSENFSLFSAGPIPFYEIASSVLVGAGLFAVFLVLILSSRGKEG
ncbi:MAG TPA: MnhB domain-containing protein [Candidatus Margulisiibacteriota bacterium]|nr:MnhB domain-containing protein [Candidatus Margulisiibacteriota bacterium]